MAKKKKQQFSMKDLLIRYDLYIALAIFLAMIPAEHFEWFSGLENQTLSARHIVRNGSGDEEQRTFTKDKISIVYLDEGFFKEYGSFPLRRTDVGTIVENLSFLGAKVIVVDMLMDFPSSYNEDPVIAESLKRAGNNLVVSMLKIEKGQIKSVNYPTEAIKNATQTAYSNHLATGTMLNRLRIYPEAAEKFNEWPVAILAYANYLGVKPHFEGKKLFIGDQRVHLDQWGDLVIDYSRLDGGVRFLSRDPFVGIPGMALLDFDREDEDMVEELQYLVKDRVVLLGDTSEVSHDIFDTLVGEVYGVEVMAQEVNTLFKGAPLQPASSTTEAAVLLILMILLLAAHFVSDPKFRFPLVILLVAAYVTLGVVTYVYLDVKLSMGYGLLAMMLGSFTINVYLFIQERKERSFIQGAFGQYLSPAVIEALVEDPDKLSLGGERRVMTAYFSDVAGFSTISESLTPEELVNLLNYYLTDMCDIISKYDGTVDKFEGDAIIAFWGAPLDQPDHATRTCWASIDMQKRLTLMREELKAEGRPLLNVRMGINSGPMVVGNMGSKTRMDYTMMGDAVNLAARLEGANKFYKNYSMISEFTYELAKDDIDVRELDRITVVGKDEPIVVYDLLERKGMTSGIKADVVEAYLNALKYYKAMRFKEAAILFQKVLKIDPNDGPSIVYFERCKQLMKNPPAADWDGIWRLTEKG
ncbi:MAG: adenylate/guanylate cyclase domain-containing protein [bacterium]|nr:adenylate/guanylate cyclase domain-containing protein [bacterium]